MLNMGEVPEIQFPVSYNYLRFNSKRLAKQNIVMSYLLGIDTNFSSKEDR